MGKNIDFVYSVLRPPIRVLVPFIEPANSNNTDIYKRNSNKLIIEFDINSRELSQFMVVDEDGGFKKLSDLLKIGNLDSISNEYRIESDRLWARTMKYDNVSIPNLKM